ncbi:MAG TPA: LysR family transcriptional regulator [Solirubrobacteraceae bacterium]|nr:LysR family transcriptional regulator [Solirubrobacteraceae bacterium]
MELRQLEYFTAVVRHGHFGRAAQDVYVTQSALSQQIARLEDELGLTLLVRTAKGAELTPAGTEFLAHARAILEQVAEARAAIDDHLGAVRGVARVAATPYDSRPLPAALVAFHRAWPGLQLALRHGSAAQVVELLSAGAVDVAVLAVHDGEPAIPAGSASRVIATEPLALICAPQGPLAGRTDASFEALRGAPVIMPERGTALRALIGAGCAAAGFSPLPFFETSDPGTVRELAAAGLGVGVVPRSWLTGADGPPIGSAAFAEPAPVYRIALLAGTSGRLPVRDLLVEHLAAAFAAYGAPRASGRSE